MPQPNAANVKWKQRKTLDRISTFIKFMSARDIQSWKKKNILGFYY